MRYPGGKGGAGVYQTIINHFPPHRVYIEPFVGGGNIFERKAPAASSILADLDPAVVDHWRQACIDRPDVEVLHADALELLSSRAWVGDELVYLDPPYHPETRRRLGLYRCELSAADHVRLLDIVAGIPVPVALSGYRHALYDEAAGRLGWRRVDFVAQTRRGPAVESLWLNFPAPSTIADFSYAGRDYRERERIKRKAARFVAKWDKLPELERGAIVQAMGDRWPGSPQVAVAAALARADGASCADPAPSALSMAPGA